ncbi:serine--tRNA synthetase-like protein Slimp [Macrosteles quadrilineatus]|uniref:serine--tRNA synthetase-like protein Slimp n=1 Tax=Macrosteles quadrilineatus TaxID=74068 RepID=UPI0023E34C63|nr:serine--tRNA synthetase-like protein Slimp [Macrosteles quadrilineatus]
MAKYFKLFKKPLFLIRPMVRPFSSSLEDQPKSSLFISGKRAQDTFVAVVPHIDFDERFKDINSLSDNIKRRKLNLNAKELSQSWLFYKDWNDKRNKLQNNLDETGRRMRELLKKEESEAKEEMKRLERLREILKKDIHEVKENIWGMEDNVIGSLLKLPNHLHKLAPENEENVYFLNNESNASKGVDHLKVGEDLNILKYYDQFTYFLKDEAAMFELALSDFCIDKLVRKDFIQFSNPDFTRSSLAEGVGTVPNDTSELFLLENTEANNDRLHMCGGASIFPFCGFHAKQVVQKDSLPVRYVASGRQYKQTTSSLPGLYSVHQSTSVQVFIATWSDKEMNEEFNSCLKVFEELFNEFGLKFRIVIQPPHTYKSWDSLRASLQVFSHLNKSFIEVGHLSLIDDFISKRLRMCYNDKKGELFLKVISGTVINAQSFLALCLERSQQKLFVPENLRHFFYL